MLVSSPEQEIKSLFCGTPAFIGEVAVKMYRVLILLDSLKFESFTGIDFDPGTHGGR